MNVSCPIVPWTELEASTLRSKPFVSLLHHVGLSPYFRGSFLYPRIPHTWSADILYSVALFFGPVDQQRIDFDLSRVRKIKLLIPVTITELQSKGECTPVDR
jgi:timeless protein